MANTYKMRISRLTVDKLGVRLYDKVSAVIAELVSNSYDADARKVIIEAPLGEYLATKADGQVIDKRLNIKVIDNGIGMTPDEVNDYYLRVGAERRTETKRGRGDLSPKFRRRVMGRKGVGKLAPFGICQRIEVLSSGGSKISRKTGGGVEKGYLTAHIILDRSKILEDSDYDYKPEVGPLDNSLQPRTGATITLSVFAYRKVPDAPTFSRQLAQRFGLSSPDWNITLRDTLKSKGAAGYETQIDSLKIPMMKGTRLNFSGPKGPNFSAPSGDTFTVSGPTGVDVSGLKAGFYLENSFYPVTGWMGYSKEPLKDDLMAGVRVYCRGKLAAQTMVFNRGAGFHGEHSIRSYLVGELHADWLDAEEDLILTDRRDILWSQEIGQAFQEWGQGAVLTIGSLARDPLRQKTWERFLEVGDVDKRIEKAFPATDQVDIRRNAQELAAMLGKTIRADEVEDKDVVEPLVELTLSLAPHITLDEQLRQAGKAATSLAALTGILRTARLAELSSFGRIAEDRLKIMKKMVGLKDDPDTAEQKLQELITYAPWLINPQWSPITANQSFSTMRSEFEKFYNKHTGEKISLQPFSETNKRPDFTLSNYDGGLQIIEIKKPGHELTNAEMDRIVKYHDLMRDFLDLPQHSEFKQIFGEFHITLVCDGQKLTGAQKTAFKKYKDDGLLTHISWSTFVLRTERMHQDFLKEAEKQRRFVSRSSDGSN